MIIIQELHQFEEGLRPAQPSSAHVWDGETWQLNASRVAELELHEAEQWCSKVDSAADSARTVLAGDPLKAMEYAQAAADAQAYQDAGYPKRGATFGCCLGSQRSNCQTGCRTDSEQGRSAYRSLVGPAHFASEGQTADPCARGQRQSRSGAKSER